MNTIDQNVIHNKRKREDESTSSNLLAVDTIADDTLAVNSSQKKGGMVGNEMMTAAIFLACRQAMVEGPAACNAVLTRYR